jgi:hypothetical protein
VLQFRGKMGSEKSADLVARGQVLVGVVQVHVVSLLLSS